MHIPQLLLLPGFFLILGLSLAFADDKGISFSTLSDGDELIIDFVSSGCFHHLEYELSFHRSSDITVSVVELRQRMSFDSIQSDDVERIPLGRLILTQDDLNGLDHLIGFYRSSRKVDCTTKDRISISKWHNNTAIASEKFTDGSCASNFIPDVTTITTLVG